MATCAVSSTGSSDAGYLWTLRHSRAAAAVLISQGEAELYRLVTRQCIFRITDQFARIQAVTGVVASRTKQQSGEMSQIDAWPSDYSILDALSRYKHPFTASVKLHTSSPRALWDDLSANVPFQTGDSRCLQGSL